MTKFAKIRLNDLPDVIHSLREIGVPNAAQTNDAHTVANQIYDLILGSFINRDVEEPEDSESAGGSTTNVSADQRMLNTNDEILTDHQIMTSDLTDANGSEATLNTEPLSPAAEAETDQQTAINVALSLTPGLTQAAQLAEHMRPFDGVPSTSTTRKVNRTSRYAVQPVNRHSCNRRVNPYWSMGNTATGVAMDNTADMLRQDYVVTHESSMDTWRQYLMDGPLQGEYIYGTWRQYPMDEPSQGEYTVGAGINLEVDNM
ncbi:MAG: hypothetical protein Q9210_004562 [Variospora velana]